MVLSWTRRKGFRFTRKEKENSNADLEMELVIPSHFRCPISLDLMKDPVTLATGITYDRESIEKWIEARNQTCPVTNQVLSSFDLIPNHSIRRMIQDWCVDNRSFGIERIPTPRTPVSPYEVLDICKKMKAATQRGDDNKCQELVGKIKGWVKESERNKKCLLDNGAGVVLSNAFESFSSNSVEKHSGLLQEILSVLTWMFPYIGEEGQAKLGSLVSLQSMVWFLNLKDLTVRQNAAVVLKDLACLGGVQVVEALLKMEGLPGALVKLIGEPVGPTATKASLTTMLQMISSSGSNKRITTRFVELGLIPLLLEVLVDAEKSICEKALGVLDRICDCPEGREMAKANALTVPLIVKKVLRVSVLASEFSVSILWKLSQKENEDVEAALMEALQLGAFQKLLVLLQVGCGERTKGKATELLKLLNTHKRKVDQCVNSSLEFKYLKKPF